MCINELRMKSDGQADESRAAKDVGSESIAVYLGSRQLDGVELREAHTVASYGTLSCSHIL